MVKNELTDSSYGVGSVGVMGEAAPAFGDFEEVVWMRGVVLCDARVREACGKRTLARAYYEYRARIGRHRHPPPRHARWKRRRGKWVARARRTRTLRVRVRAESFSSNVDSGAQSGRLRVCCLLFFARIVARPSYRCVISRLI